MTAAAVIVAAGKGERFGNSGKVLAEILNRPLIEYSLDAFDEAASITEIVIVAGAHTEFQIQHLVSSGNWQTPIQVVPGGETRQQSTANGIRAVSPEMQVILVHDAARPLIQAEQIEACVEAANLHGGAILATPVTDTIKKVSDGTIEATIDRAHLWAAQTPQGFRAHLLRQMMSRVDDSAVTDEASLAEIVGVPVHIVPGSASNLKVTHPSDLVIAEALLRARKEES